MKKIALLIPVIFLLSISTSFATEENHNNDNVIKIENAQILNNAVEFLYDSRNQDLEASMWYWNEFAKQPANIRNDNYGGIIGLALLQAYKETGNIKPLSLARNYADRYSGILENNSIEDIKLARPSIVFFAELYNVTGDKKYYNWSKAFMDKFINEKVTARKIINDYYKRNIRNSISMNYDYLSATGYDVSWDIKALLVTGNRKLAKEVADLALEEKAFWYPLKPERSPVALQSIGAMMWALAALDKNYYKNEIEEFGDILISTQDMNGSWANNYTQTTAYALLGLKANRQLEGSEHAIGAAEVWLKNTELEKGAWGSYNDGISELAGEIYPAIHSEVLLALVGL